MRNVFFFCSLIISISFTSHVSAGEAVIMRAGTARVKITPQLPMWLTGYAGRDSSAKGVLHDIWAKALAIEEKPGHRVVIVTLDILGLSHEIVENVVNRSDSLYGLKRSQLILNSSHTHSGPMIWPCLDIIYDFNLKQQQIVSEYAISLTKNIVEVIGKALGNMVPAQLATGRGTADFAINRRNDIHPNGPVDHEVMVLKVSDKNNKMMAVLFGYACHNTTLVDDNFLINGDYAGFAQIDLEEKIPGAQAMFLQGCAGDQNPSPRGTVQLASLHGQQLADAVEKVLSATMKTVRAPLVTAYTNIQLPYNKFDPAVYEKEITRTDIYVQRRAKLMLDSYNRGWVPQHLNYPIQAVRFNHDLTILALSGETVVDYSLNSKKEFANENLFVAGYTNEVMCYIPSLRVLKEGGYEAADNMIYYGFPGPFTENVEHDVFRGIRQVMKTLDVLPTSKNNRSIQ